MELTDVVDGDAATVAVTSGPVAVDLVGVLVPPLLLVRLKLPQVLKLQDSRKLF